jgi:hypothetical protein
MTEALIAKILVVNLSDSGEVASTSSPEQFVNPDIDKISHITNEIVVNLQNNIIGRTEDKQPGALAISEVELAFGIDFGVEANSQLKIPIIGPLIGGGIKAGATFEVHIKLSRNNS